MNATPPSASDALRSPVQQPTPIATGDRGPDARPPDVVDSYVEDSFPASDPPGWWAGAA